MNTTKRLFGTDGVRGVANQELTCEMAFGLGAAAVQVLGPALVIGRDTRVSGSMLEAALVAGITSRGGTAQVAGVIPTPAVALLTRELKADGGVVISASHNPPQYNGIKFFNGEGYKVSQEEEDRLEAGMRGVISGETLGEQGVPEHGQKSGGGKSSANKSSDGNKSNGTSKSSDDSLISLPTGNDVGTVMPIEDARERYISHAVSLLEKEHVSLKKLKIAVDCGNGASHYTTPEAFRRLGAEVAIINDSGDGRIINVESGSTNLEQLRQLVKTSKADVGIAHDGDADRVIAVSASGAEIDGDYILAICALDRKANRGLPGNTLVGTVMCNIGFVQAMEEAGLKVVQTPVGDSNVLAAMRRGGYAIGGEQSGHTIFLEYNTTGDGLITALMLLAALRRSGLSLDDLAAKAMKKYPQTLINVPLANKHLLDSNQAVAAAVAQAESELEAGGGGRVLLRASGTEPLVRVMVEAAEEPLANSIAQTLADTVKAELA